jgi:hypothetical protein
LSHDLRFRNIEFPIANIHYLSQPIGCSSCLHDRARVDGFRMRTARAGPQQGGVLMRLQLFRVTVLTMVAALALVPQLLCAAPDIALQMTVDTVVPAAGQPVQFTMSRAACRSRTSCRRN